MNDAVNAICGPAPTRGPRPADLSLGELDSILGSMPLPGGQYGGSWIGWYLRVLFGAKHGLPTARRIVIGAVGPGHDYEEAPSVVESRTGCGQRAPRRKRKP